MLYTLTIYYPKHTLGTKIYRQMSLQRAVTFGKLAFELGNDFDIKEEN